MDEPSDDPSIDDDLKQHLSASDRDIYEHASLRRTMTKVVIGKLRSLFPGEFIPEFRNLEDASEMLGDASEGRDQRYYQAGLREGMAGGAEALLLHMLQRQFGDLPQHLRLHLQTAGLDELKRWGDWLIDALTEFKR